MPGTAPFQDKFWTSSDGLNLHYRDYAGPASKPALLCMPGLTRNARDFEGLASRLAGRFRVICVEFRGRGESEPAQDAASYNPLVYAQDVELLIKQIRLKKFICVGTSLGGLVTMLLAASRAGRMAGALFNDVGPVVETAGLERIRGYVGRFQSWPTWVHAARALMESQGDVYPDYGLVEWVAMAKRLHRLTTQGRVVPDYDMRIAEPMKESAPAADLWPAWDALGNTPVLVLRGANSDILSAETAKEMTKRLPAARLVTVPRVGHAPSLDEPASIRAIEAFLKSLDS